MQRLLIVSNRLPVTVEKKKDGLDFQQSSGGLATGLGSFYKSYDSIWVGWPGIPRDKLTGREEKSIKKKMASDFDCHPVFISQSDIEKYYYGFCNKTFWPLSHYFTEWVAYDKGFWTAYKSVNELFCRAISQIREEGDIIWIHDYQLMLLPKLLREKFPDATIGYFHHIPFPSFEIFRLLPWRKEIAGGLLGADIIGFHTFDYAGHFLKSVHRLLGYEHSWGQINAEDRIINVDVFPMGIDFERFSETAKSLRVQEEVKKIRRKLGERKIILSVDRLDYTKGIPQRLRAFDTFLKRHPRYREKVTFILLSVPSRTKVEHYRLLKREVDEIVGKINGEHGTIGWIPIWYLYRSVPFHSLVALYSIADISFITPLRDGMNLIAKEYIASKTDGKGVLILSELTGASKELGEVITINPNNREEMVEALEKALRMPVEKQIENNMVMQDRLRRYDVRRWAEEFISRLFYTKKVQKGLYAKIITPETKNQLIKDYRKSKRRLLFLDYDGTLIPFFGKPEEAEPGQEILKLIERLADDSRNEVVLISGRDRETLEKWFGHLNIRLVAEHGAWIREKGWQTIEPLTSDWKKKIRPILEVYVDRTPKSFIEDKGFSLVWHYRKADPELSSLRVRELMDELINLTANLNLDVSEGKKVIEIKNAGINKGRAALRWISKEKWDFILSAGDDWTDEDVFEILPDTAYSIKVGLSPSKARFNLNTTKDVLLLLKELSS